MINTFIPKFTYVIPFRFEQDRIIPLKRVVELLSGFHGIEILIVEQDKYSKISHLNLKANHLFIKSEAPFNKSWAYNVALKRIISPIIVCGDADFIMNPNDLIESLKILENYDCVIPTSKILNLTHQQTLGDIQSIFNQASLAQPKMNLTDGISLFKKEALLKICGWNEDFFGTSHLNEYQDMKIRGFLNWQQLDYVGYHLFHQPEPFDANLQNRNMKIYEYFRDGNREKLDMQMKDAASKIGQKNRFAQY
jgi:hypothetical protein